MKKERERETERQGNRGGREGGRERERQTREGENDERGKREGEGEGEWDSERESPNKPLNSIYTFGWVEYIQVCPLQHIKANERTQNDLEHAPLIAKPLTLNPISPKPKTLQTLNSKALARNSNPKPYKPEKAQNLTDPKPYGPNP